MDNFVGDNTRNPHLGTKIWTLEPEGLYTCKPLFDHLTRDPTCLPLPITKEFWEAPVPSKVKVLVSIAIHQRLNTNKILQIRWPNQAPSLTIYVMCYTDGETHFHLFLHCEIAWNIWNKVFAMFGFYYVVLPIVTG